MRMKKYFILAAVAAIAATACTKSFEVVPTQDPTIGFGSWANTLTKAEARVQGSNTFLAGDTFAVYGYKDKTSPAPVTVFDDVVVTASGDPLTWNYEGTKFWDTNYDKYVFFGVSPSSIGTAGTVNPQTGAITSASITFAGNDNDILVADKTTVNKTDGSPYFNNFGAVNLAFNHVASLVDIKAKKTAALNGTVVSVSSIALQQIEKTGVLTVSTAYTDSHPVASWSTTAKGTYGPANGVTPVDISSPIAVATDSAFPADDASDEPAAATDLIKSLVVKPQTFGATGQAESQQLVITYTVGDVQHTATLYLADFDRIDNTAQAASYVGSWDAGKHYIFYLTIDAHAISFTASINDWDATVINGYHYLLQ